MKVLTTISLLFIFGCSQAQDSIIMDFVSANLDKRCGTGLCLDFVEQAENLKHKNWYNDYYKNQDSMQVYQVWKNKVQPGDVVIFDNVVTTDSTRMNHIGIVCQMNGDTLIYASQNVELHKNDKRVLVNYKGKNHKVLKNSIVQLDFMLMTSEDIARGDVYYFHF